MSSSIVLITGANSGVGFAIARILAGVPAPSKSGPRPFHIIMTGRNVAKVEAARSSLLDSADADAISTLQLEITSPYSIAAAVAMVKAKWGKLDVLINNAAIYTRDADPPTNDLAAELTKSFATNVTGAALVTEAFAPLLEAAVAASKQGDSTSGSKGQYLLHVSSGLGSLELASTSSRPDYNLVALGYRASKAALNMVAIQHHRDLGAKGIKVFTLCPGLVESNLRGESEQARTYGGLAGDPLVSGRFVLSILKGERDSDVGKFVHNDGVYSW